jgi:hypothetical protein
MKEDKEMVMGEDILRKIKDEIGNQYPNISNWMEAMQFTKINKMIRHSFIRAYVFKNFNISEFCEGFNGFLKKNHHRIDSQPFRVYEEFIKTAYSLNKKFLCGNLIKKRNLPGKICHYLNAYKFYKTVMGEGDGARGSREKAHLKKRRIFRLMKANKLTPDDMSHWQGELKGAIDIFWFTKYDSIPDKFRKCSDNPVAAQAIRDLLGSPHLYNDVLIEVQIPKNLAEKAPKVPTICDAGGYPYFRPAIRIDGFGRTINLDKRTTGLPEGVHEKINWDKSFATRYVGDLPKKKKEFSDTEWNQLIDKSEEELIAFLEGLQNEA